MDKRNRHRGKGVTGWTAVVLGALSGLTFALLVHFVLGRSRRSNAGTPYRLQFRKKTPDGDYEYTIEIGAVKTDTSAESSVGAAPTAALTPASQAAPAQPAAPAKPLVPDAAYTNGSGHLPTSGPSILPQPTAKPLATGVSRPPSNGSRPHVDKLLVEPEKEMVAVELMTADVQPRDAVDRPVADAGVIDLLADRRLSEDGGFLTADLPASDDSTRLGRLVAAILYPLLRLLSSSLHQADETVETV